MMHTSKAMVALLSLFASLFSESEATYAKVEKNTPNTIKNDDSTEFKSWTLNAQKAMSADLRDKPTDNPDIHLNVTELIKKYGFPVESHHVFTKDDYVLTLHRIPFGRNNGTDPTKRYNETLPKELKKPVVFLQHGLCSSSADWIMNTADKALPYMLADNGFDVWLGNARGNGYSRRHITTTSKRSKYWDFSWHEMGDIDIPAIIDYILKLTGQDRLNYVGHSMGTTMFFVAMSLHPEYNAKINKMAALGPAVYIEGMKSPLRYLAPFSTTEKYIFDLFGNGELLPEFLLKYMHKFGPLACQPDSIASGVCDNIIYVAGGYNPFQINETQLPVILAHAPSSSSTKAAVHYFQSLNTAEFRQYNYGTSKNLIKYGHKTPPLYNLKNVKAKVALYWGANDILCVPKGVRRLANELPNLIGSFQVGDEHFTHIDFIFAKDADKLLYRDLLKLFQEE